MPTGILIDVIAVILGGLAGTALRESCRGAGNGG